MENKSDYNIESRTRYDRTHNISNVDYLYAIKDLFENRHYSDIFEKCIDDILSSKPKYYKGYIYTGWSYDNHTYALNTNSIGHKIYVYIHKIPNKNNSKVHGYIRGRFEYGSTDNINIALNINSNDITLKSFLQHEYTHMIKMYSSDKKDNTNNNRDNIDKVEDLYLQELPKLKVVSEDFAFLVNKLVEELYIFSETEQEASINGSCMYIKSLSKDVIHKNMSEIYNQAHINRDDKVILNPLAKEAQLYYLIANIPSDICFIYRYINFKETYSSYMRQGYRDICLIIGYYLLKHKWYRSGSKYLTSAFLNKNMYALDEYIKKHPNEKDDIFMECMNIFKKINKIYNDYRKKLYDALYQIINDNKLFLTESILEHYIPDYHYHILMSLDTYNINEEYCNGTEYTYECT